MTSRDELPTLLDKAVYDIKGVKLVTELVSVSGNILSPPGTQTFLNWFFEILCND